VAIGYRPVVGDQEFLLPPNMADWLPGDHLVWFVLDVVAELDTTVLRERAARRRDGQPVRSAAGRAAYDPDMLLALLIYGYACGERSRRRIERLCASDVGFRLLCAGDIPDHTVLARFRQVHAEAFAGLFAQVLRLCRAAGLARLATVAIDGSKIAANASAQANRSGQWLAEEAQRLDRETAEQILAEAGAVDTAEDAQFGSARGDELPPGWDSRAGRREPIRAAQAPIQAAQLAKAADEQAAQQGRAQRDTAALAQAEAGLAAEIVSGQGVHDTWERAWEHAVANPGAPLPRGRAPVPVEQSVHVPRARQRVDRARERVEHPDTAPRRGRPRPEHPGPGNPDSQPRANLTDPDSTIMPTKHGWVQG